MKKLYHYPSMLVFSLLAVMILIVFEISAFVQLVLFKPDIYSTAIGRKSVNDAVYEDLLEYFEQFSAPTGVPAEVFTDPIDKEELSKASFDLLMDSLDYLTDKNAPKPEIKYDFKPFEDSVVGYIEKYSEENDIVKDDEYYDLIDNTVTTGENQIVARLDLMMLFQLSNTRYGEIVHQKSWLIRDVMFVSLGVLVVILMIMVIIDRHHVRDLPYWLGLILMVSGLVFLLPAIYLDSINYFSTFFIRSPYIYLTVTGVFEELLSRVIYFELSLVILGLILIIATIIIHVLYKNYRIKKHRMKHGG